MLSKPKEKGKEGKSDTEVINERGTDPSQSSCFLKINNIKANIPKYIPSQSKGMNVNKKFSKDI